MKSTQQTPKKVITSSVNAKNLRAGDVNLGPMGRKGKHGDRVQGANTTQKVLIIIIVLAVLIISGLLAVYFFRNKQQDQESTTNSDTTTQRLDLPTGNNTGDPLLTETTLQSFTSTTKPILCKFPDKEETCEEYEFANDIIVCVVVREMISVSLKKNELVPLLPNRIVASYDVRVKDMVTMGGNIIQKGQFRIVTSSRGHSPVQINGRFKNNGTFTYGAELQGLDFVFEVNDQSLIELTYFTIQRCHNTIFTSNPVIPDTDTTEFQTNLKDTDCGIFKVPVARLVGIAFERILKKHNPQLISHQCFTQGPAPTAPVDDSRTNTIK